jgi:sulfur relay (sulfurtransferase) DsrC/TusE family protein
MLLTDQSHTEVTQYLQNFFLQSYNTLKLRNVSASVRIMLKTLNFQQHSSPKVFTYNFKLFTRGGNTTQTNKNAFL